MAHLTIDNPAPGEITTYRAGRPSGVLQLRDASMVVDLWVDDLDSLDELILALGDLRAQLVRTHADWRGRHVRAVELGEGDEIILDGRRSHVETVVITGGPVLVRCEDGHRYELDRTSEVLVLGDPPPLPPSPSIGEVISAFGARR
jgi:hypothetical protein